MLPDEFTLLQLQKAAEALAGVHLHKQNFRRPAKLHRFRREVLREARETLGRRIGELKEVKEHDGAVHCLNVLEGPVITFCGWSESPLRGVRYTSQNGI